MVCLQLLVALILVTGSSQDISNNQVDNSNIFDEAAASIFQEQNAQNLGGMLNNLMQSDSAKQLGDILSNAATDDGASQILQGLGSVLGQGQGIDPTLMGTMFNLFQQTTKSGDKNDEGFDPSVILQLAGSLMGQSGETRQDFWSYVPLVLQTVNAFLGPEADERARAHSQHAELLPPVLEKIHLFFDHFLNSEIAKKIFNTIGAERWVKVFADENGRFTYRRFVDMLENHSFRKHWIRMLTDRIASLLSNMSEARTQKKYLTTFQHFLNGLIRAQGYPKTVLFEPNRPTETITALVNHFVKVSFNIKISSKQYVKPAVEYFQESFKLAQNKGMLNVNSEELSNKLADTINLEVIEPIARVNRAYRFARKVPECDRYVMCLVNQEPQDDNPSLPGLRPLLSKSASFVFSWFLSSHTKTPFWSFYKTIVEEENCQMRFSQRCNDFHLEEIKVKREIVHSEL